MRAVGMQAMRFATATPIRRRACTACSTFARVLPGSHPLACHSRPGNSTRSCLTVISLARAFPDTSIILNHVGGPLGMGPYAGRSEETFAFWKRHMLELASCPNVTVKLGGLGMRIGVFDFHLRPAPPSSQELADAWRPWIETCIEAFGADRCMFESNFPVDKITTGYAVLWNAFKRIAQGASASEKAALFSGTARRIYRL